MRGPSPPHLLPIGPISSHRSRIYPAPAELPGCHSEDALPMLKLLGFRRLLVLSVALGLATGFGLAVVNQTRAVTYTVTDFGDVADAAPGDGTCETAPGNGGCTLRAAIQEANAAAGPAVIALPQGTFTLSLTGTGEDAATTGDLDITDTLTITGAGAGRTFIDAAGIDRVFHVHAGASLELSI